MKTLLMMTFAALACVCTAADSQIMDIRPSAESVKGAPSGVDWQNRNNKALAEATKPEVLKAIVKDAAKADALCQAVRPLYFMDSLKAHQLAAVTQFVMLPGKENCPCRKTWVNALVKAAKAAKDPSVKTFFLDQLRWCACEKCIPAVREIAAGGDRNLKEFGELVARELAGRK